MSMKSDEGCLATRDERGYPDWERRLRRARKQAEQGKAISLDDYLERRARR